MPPTITLVAKKVPLTFSVVLCTWTCTQKCKNHCYYPLDLPKQLPFTRYRNKHTHLHALCKCMHAFTYCSKFDTSLIIIQCSMKIRLHLPEIWGFVHCPKLHTHFHVLCVQVCTPENNIYKLRRTMLWYAESFVKIWLNFAKILRCVTW